MSQTKPTQTVGTEPVPKTGRFEATSAGLAFYIKRAKMAGVPLGNVGREIGYVLHEFDQLTERCERLEKALAELASSSATKRKAEG